MPVANSLPTVTVTVRAAGTAIPEHLDINTADTFDTVIRYIEANSDQIFEIHMHAGRHTQYRGDALAFDVSVDGNKTDEPFVWRTGKHKTTWHHSQGVPLPGGKIQKYQFSTLDKREDIKSDKQRMAQFPDLGTIKIEAHHARSYGACDVQMRPGPLQLGAISEKDVKGKALSHSVGFGPMQGYNEAGSASYYLQFMDPKPVATYIFRYRSKEALQAELIIPRAPNPRPLEERDPDTLSREELVQLARRSQASQQEREAKVKIKQEGEEVKGDVKKVKREEETKSEEGGKRRKLNVNNDIITIELDDEGEVIRETRAPQARNGPQVDLDD